MGNFLSEMFAICQHKMFTTFSNQMFTAFSRTEMFRVCPTENYVHFSNTKCMSFFQYRMLLFSQTKCTTNLGFSDIYYIINQSIIDFKYTQDEKLWAQKLAKMVAFQRHALFSATTSEQMSVFSHMPFQPI